MTEVDDHPQEELEDRPRVLVAVTGGIACYKVCHVVSRLSQEGVDVRVMMTEAATHFVTPLTFQSLSGQPVYTSLWQAPTAPESQHIELARWPHVVLVAPATANIIGKLAQGICDDLVSTTLTALPSELPVVLAPAMNADMWANPIVQRNASTLRDLLHYRMVGPESGWQACRTQGAGRMSEPQAILQAVREELGLD